MISPTLDPAYPIFLPDPVNRHHPLNAGRRAWWLTLPGLDGGGTWYDLMGLCHAPLNNMDAASGYRGTTRPGGWGHLLFDGVNDFANAGSPPALSPTTGLSVAAWVRPTSTPATNAAILKKNGSYILRFGASNALAAFINGSSIVGGTAPNGAWSRVVSTYDQVNLKLYVNGLEVATNSLAVAITANGNPLSIGATTASAEALPASIDDVSVWGRGLSAAEVFADFMLSRAGYPGVLNRWRPSITTFLASGTTITIVMPGLLTAELIGAVAASPTSTTAAPGLMSGELLGATSTSAAAAAAAPGLPS
ncbi:MAG: hypothetical protein JWQ01_4597, partial [Massilia sp.]|nr:hypothetical protein [Massilia sp.]